MATKCTNEDVKMIEEVDSSTDCTTLDNSVKKVLSVVHNDLDSDLDGFIDVADVYTTFSVTYGYNDVDISSISTLMKANSTMHNGRIDFKDYVCMIKTLCTGTLIRSPLIVGFIYRMLDISHKSHISHISHELNQKKTFGLYYELIASRLKVLDELNNVTLSNELKSVDLCTQTLAETMTYDDLLFKEFIVCIIGLRIRHIVTVGSIIMNFFYLMICLLVYYLLF